MVSRVTDVCWKIFKKKFRQLKVEPFGGFVNGLGTKRSDIDIVLTGMFSPDGGKQGGLPKPNSKTTWLILLSRLSRNHEKTRERVFERYSLQTEPAYAKQTTHSQCSNSHFETND